MLGTIVGEQRHPRYGLIAAVPLLVIGALLVMSSPANAASVKCGDVITANTTLKASLSGCPGNGLIVRANNVTLDLGGHVVSAANGPEETVGILLDRVRGVTVKRGTVRRFDAGVNIEGGSQNTLTGLDVRYNINDNIAPASPAEDCFFGDGITTTSSDLNEIVDNDVSHNGPYSGISLVNDSDSNDVHGNRVSANNIPNEDAAPGIQGNGFCGAPFSRPIQDIGIRVEGPGANNNDVHANRVWNSAIGGITIHGYIYNNPGGGPPDKPNTFNVVQSNYVASTGAATSSVDPLADGIGILRQGPGFVVGVSQDNYILNNEVVGSRQHGIFVGNPTQTGEINGNTVKANYVTSSAVDGISLANGSINNTIARNFARYSRRHDGHDGNVDCDSNVWSLNDFAWVNRACVAGPPAQVR